LALPIAQPPSRPWWTRYSKISSLRESL
jgi:hypothetical protein